MDPRITPGGPMAILLEQAGVDSLSELVEKRTDEIVPILARMTIPPSEALLGALVIHAVTELRQATDRLNVGSNNLNRMTVGLLCLTGLALLISAAALIATFAQH
jgi:hypothetical protein